VTVKAKPDDIAEIAAKFTDVDSGIQKDLILISGLPGVGKSTLAVEFVRQARATHFEIDELKRAIVPAEIIADAIDPPEYRYQYYMETMRRLPKLFAESPSGTVVIDETFHLQEFRTMWEQAAEALSIRLHWIESVCDEEIVKERLGVGKDRHSHILGEKAYPMYLLFKQAFEPMEGLYEVVDTSKDILPQVERIVQKLSLTDKI
jgi:predicted kinase